LKTRLNAHGFAHELIRSRTGYGPGRNVKRCGTSLLVCTRKKSFWLGGTDFLWVTS